MKIDIIIKIVIAALVLTAILFIVLMVIDVGSDKTEDVMSPSTGEPDDSDSDTTTSDNTIYNNTDQSGIKKTVDPNTEPVDANTDLNTDADTPNSTTIPSEEETNPSSPQSTRTPTSNSNSPQQRARTLADAASNSNGIDNSWALQLVNAKNPLASGFVPNLTSIGSYGGENREFDNRGAAYAKLMMEAAQNDGLILTPVSSYRRVVRQEENFRASFNSFVSQGHSRERAFDLTAEQIAVPRTSEHNAGLAIDFNSISTSFDQTAEFHWLRDNAHHYGFILRYPSGTTSITGIIYEPWHWRFVGLHHAEKIKNSGQVLEQYISNCKDDESAVAAWRAQLVG